MAELIFWIGVIGVSAYIVLMLAAAIQNKRTWKRIENERQAKYQRHGVPAEALQSNGSLPGSDCLSGGTILREGELYGYWFANERVSFLPSETENCIKIPSASIVYYRCIGDEHYYTEVSGGGGGGSNLTGAVIGGVLAGGTGAVIGSRKGANSIQTTVRHINNKQTMLYVNLDGKLLTLSFASDRLYQKLLSWIPEKDFIFVSAANSSTCVRGETDGDAESRLRQLKKMFDKELITEEEYNEKRKHILSEL